MHTNYFVSSLNNDVLKYAFFNSREKRGKHRDSFLRNASPDSFKTATYMASVFTLIFVVLFEPSVFLLFFTVDENIEMSGFNSS